MDDLGRGFIVAGLALLVVGALWLILSRFGLPRLPGDLVFQRGGLTIFIPLATSVVLSVVLTVLLNLWPGGRP